jgi:SPP1 gp7 family putative phage head morphogenesis protein|nr:MAG TPA: minor capsid protein [Caudoviricetes sp.]
MPTATKTESAKKSKIAELAKQIADHQARLQVIGSNWGEIINDALDATEKKFLEKLQKELKNFDFVPNQKKTLQQLKKINEKLVKIRAQAFSDAQKNVENESKKLAENEVEWGKRVTKEMTGEKKLNEPSGTSLSRVIQNYICYDKTLQQWFSETSYDDAARIESIVSRGLSSGWTIDQIADNITGTAENGYKDGIFNTTRREAVNMARTVCNGIANGAKEQFYKANDDVITGVEILSTLDGRVCPVCGSLDRKRYKLDEEHPSLPLHPNCRCVLLPVTPASDFADEQRPMAKADFMSEAQRSYEAKNKGKKFSELDEEQKKKLYYQAMREYEKRTGEPAYEQSDGAVSFREYFNEHMTEQQRKDWLGPERYKLWKKGGLKLDKFIPPYPQKRLTVEELKKLDQASFAS